MKKHQQGTITAIEAILVVMMVLACVMFIQIANSSADGDVKCIEGYKFTVFNGNLAQILNENGGGISCQK